MKTNPNGNKKNVLVISGPTGTGETTITMKVIERYPIFQRLVTATTRKPRLNEKNKVEYYFFSKKKFKKELAEGNIIEYTYIKNRDVYYGSYKKDLDQKLKKGLNVIVNPDMIGTKYFKKKYNATTIFLMPDSMKHLVGRLLKRQPDMSNEELEKRLENAKNEIKNEKKFYDFVVINREGRVEEATNKIIRIIKKEGYEFGQENSE